MKTLFSAIVIVAFSFAIYFSNQKTDSETKLVFGDPPVIVIPPIKSFQSTTTFYQLVSCTCALDSLQYTNG